VALERIRLHIRQNGFRVWWITLRKGHAASAIALATLLNCVKLSRGGLLRDHPAEVPIVLVSAILKAKGNSVVTVEPATPVATIVRKLADHRIGAVVVVDHGIVCGIVSERDIVMALAASEAAGPAMLAGPADAIMTSPVITCGPNETADQIMSEMTARRFRHFPVVDKGALIGIVSIGDLVKLRIAEVEMESAAMREYITAR
jgi:CBS domain-containing protein